MGGSLHKQVTMPLQVNCDGMVWRLFGVDFQADGKHYGTYVYAIDAGHAAMIIEDLKSTAKLGGELLDIADRCP